MNLYGYAGGDPVNYGDPFGLCPRVNVYGKDKKNVLIRANVDGGPLVSAADMTRVREGIERYWGGSRHGYNVTLILDDPGAPTIFVDITRADGGQGASNGRDAGGVMQVTKKYGTTVMKQVAAHEFGHVLTLPNEKTDTRNLMYGEINVNKGAGTEVTQKQLEEAIKNCKVD
jgi:hypothetical protein